MEAIRAKPEPSPCVAPVPVSGGMVGAEPFLGPKSFMIHSTSSGKVFTSSLCKGTVAQRGEVTSRESHSLQELWGWDSNPALTPKPRLLASKLPCLCGKAAALVQESRIEPRETSGHVH